jgi:hypothetical protein
MEPIDTTLFGIVHRPKKINSKIKGNSNELVVSKLISDWTGHEFTRVPMSGGLRWGSRVDICGDIINVDRNFDFQFSVETKAIKNLGLKDGWDVELRKNSKIYGYWEQCKRDAEAAKKIPFLIIRHNGMKRGAYFIFLDLTLGQMMKIGNYVQPEITGNLSGFYSEDFFKSITYEQLKWIYS